MTTETVRLDALVSLLLRRGYYPVAPECAGEGAQLINGQWHMPRWGCDTLQFVIDKHGDELANIMICVKTHSKKDGSSNSDVVQFIADENSCCCTCRHSDQTASGIVCNTTRKKHFECINSKNLVNWERGTCRKIAVYVDDGKVMKEGGK